MKTFHAMEEKFSLFNLGRQDGIPIWDMLRVFIYTGYIVCSNPPSEGQKTRNRVRVFPAIISFFRLLFKRRRILFLEFPHQIDENEKYYDHLSRQLISTIPQSKRVVINRYCEAPTCYNDINVRFLSFYTLLSPVKYYLKEEDFLLIEHAIEECFGVKVSYDFLNDTLRYHLNLQKGYELLIRYLKPKKAFVSGDLQKGFYNAAKKYGVETYEFQHAGILYDYISYSYPQSIKKDDNISLSDHYLMFGEVWRNVNNYPTDRITIGNDYFFPKAAKREIEKKYILIITSKYHSQYLMPLSLELARLLPEMKVIFKLHPEEYKDKDTFLEYYGNVDNVDVVTNEYDLQGLINHAEMLVLIYSSVCYEALNQGKKVAVLEESGYENIFDFLRFNPLLKVTRNSREIVEFLQLDVEKKEPSLFYCHFKYEVAKEIIN